MSYARMILPDAIHRHWNAIEPAALGIVSVGGSGFALILAQSATTPAEYGGLFVGFLIFIGLGVLGIAIATAGFIVKAMAAAMADMGGAQASKVFSLDPQSKTDARFSAIEEASERRANGILETLKVIQANITEQTSALTLLKQHVENQVDRGDELRDVIRKDVEELQGVLRRRRTDTDETRRPTS